MLIAFSLNLMFVIFIFFRTIPSSNVLSGSGGKRTKISRVNLDESDAETMVNVVPGSKREREMTGYN